MRRICMAAAAGAFLAFGAGAASAQDWSGPYIGLSVGGGAIDDDENERVVFDTNLDGGLGDTVRNAAMVDAFGPTTANPGGFCGGKALSDNFTVGCIKDDGVGVDFAARLRVGHTVGHRGLAYVTGGAATAQLVETFFPTNTANSFAPLTSEDDATGYQAGFGAEFRMSDRVTRISLHKPRRRRRPDRAHRSGNGSCDQPLPDRQPGRHGPAPGIGRDRFPRLSPDPRRSLPERPVSPRTAPAQCVRGRFREGVVGAAGLEPATRPL